MLGFDIALGCDTASSSVKGMSSSIDSCVWLPENVAKLPGSLTQIAVLYARMKFRTTIFKPVYLIPGASAKFKTIVMHIFANP